MASIDRSALSGLIPEPVTREIMQGAIAESAVLRMGRRLANMSSKTQTINVLDALPSAYFVNGEASDSGAGEAFKQTTKMAWDNRRKRLLIPNTFLRSHDFRKKGWPLLVSYRLKRGLRLIR